MAGSVSKHSYTVKKSVDFTVKYIASVCQFIYRYFYGPPPVQHWHGFNQQLKPSVGIAIILALMNLHYYTDLVHQCHCVLVFTDFEWGCYNQMALLYTCFD